MKNLLIIISGIFLSILFTGCSTLSFNQEYVAGNLENNLNKVSKKVEVSYQKNEPNVLSKRPNSIRGALSKLSIDMGNVNNGVLNGFLSQYFKNVTTNENSDLKIISKVINYEYEYGLIKTVEMEVFLNIKVLHKNKVILNKDYKSDDENVMALISFTRLSGGSYAEELFHKSILSIYENQFKKDLLIALKNNL